MHGISAKEPEESSIHSTSPSVVNCCPLWWTSAASGVPPSSISRNLNLNLDSPTQHRHHVKQLGPQLQDQDSSSTQSTGQSDHEPASAGYDKTLWKQVNGHMKSVLTLGTPDFVFPSSKVDHTQSVACIPYSYADPYVGGILAAYGPQAFIHPQMMGIQSTRVPLPVEFADEEPIYVNAKQYHGILRRRQSRAKLEAQNKLVKARKPYLHESRHLHAMKRARGSGGRFLNTKKLQQSEPILTTKGDNTSGGSSLQQLGGSLSEPEVLQSEHSNMVATVTCSEVTSVSNKDIFLKANLGFPGFHSHAGGSLQRGGGIMHSGTQHRVSVTL